MLKESYEVVTDFVYTDKIRRPAKVGIALAILLLVLGVDYWFRFSDTYITSTKIAQIEKIETLLQSTSLRPQARSELIRLEESAIERQNLWSTLTRLPALVRAKITTTNTAQKSAPTSPTQPAKPKATISVFWHYVTAGWMYWLYILVSPLVMLNRGTSSGGVIAIIAFDLVLIPVAMLFAYMLAFIPLLYSPWVNYTLNVLISGSPLGLLIWFALRYEKKQATASPNG